MHKPTIPDYLPDTHVSELWPESPLLAWGVIGCDAIRVIAYRQWASMNRNDTDASCQADSQGRESLRILVSRLQKWRISVRNDAGGRQNLASNVQQHNLVLSRQVAHVFTQVDDAVQGATWFVGAAPSVMCTRSMRSAPRRYFQRGGQDAWPPVALKTSLRQFVRTTRTDHQPQRHKSHGCWKSFRFHAKPTVRIRLRDGHPVDANPVRVNSRQK